MVVVAIIGILAAVGIPSFKKYQAKSKTTEAKVHLAAMYVAETTFYADFDVYVECLTILGYNHYSEKVNRYYMTGFDDSSVTDCDLSAQQNGANYNCTGGGELSYFRAGKGIGGQIADSYELMGPSTAPYQAVVSPECTEFITGAVGYVGTGGSSAVDSWVINQNKSLTHVMTGY